MNEWAAFCLHTICKHLITKGNLLIKCVVNVWYSVFTDLTFYVGVTSWN